MYSITATNLRKYEECQIKSANLEIHAADYYQFYHLQNGALMNK